MSEYFTGEEILRGWGIQGFELFEYVRRGLKPYDNTGRLYHSHIKYDLHRILENIKGSLSDLDHPDFPKNLSYWDRDRLDDYNSYEEVRNEVKEAYKDRSEKLKKIQMDENFKIEYSWKYCNLPNDNTDALKLIDSIVNSFYLRSDVLDVLGPALDGFLLSNKKLDHRDVQKARCRQVSTKIWKVNPEMTIVDMIKHPDMVPYIKHKNGKLYVEKTIREWINDLCPNRNPGRRYKK